MRKSILGLFVIACWLLVVAGHASAITVTFGDNSNYWPDWYHIDGKSGDDGKDTLAIPQFTGGSAEINESGYLTNLTFGQGTSSSNLWELLTPGDLFIDWNNDQIWDYVVKLFADKSGYCSWDNFPDPGAGSYPLYSVQYSLGNKADVGNTAYILSGRDKSENFGAPYNWDWKRNHGGYYIRDDHPVALDLDHVLMDNEQLVNSEVYFSGWDNSPAAAYSFEFDAGLIGLGPSFAIGWTVNCANDVIYETLDNPNPNPNPDPIPEPTTMLLLGTGLIGLACLGRKKLKESNLIK